MDGATAQKTGGRVAGAELRDEAERFRLENPGARARDIAVALGSARRNSLPAGAATA